MQYCLKAGPIRPGPGKEELCHNVDRFSAPADAGVLRLGDRRLNNVYSASFQLLVKELPVLLEPHIKPRIQN